jgi:acyl carrier protein
MRRIRAPLFATPACHYLQEPGQINAQVIGVAARQHALIPAWKARGGFASGCRHAGRMTYKFKSSAGSEGPRMSLSPDSILDVVAQEALVDRDKLAPDATLDSLGIASLDVISIVFALEDRFGIVLEPSEFEAVRTVSDVVVLITSKAAADQAS